MPLVRVSRQAPGHNANVEAGSELPEIDRPETPWSLASVMPLVGYAAPALSLIGLIAHVGLRAGYDSFYESLQVTPEEVGVTQLSIPHSLSGEEPVRFESRLPRWR